MMVGALLMATLVGVAGARPSGEVSVSATKTVSIAVADCIAKDDGQDYSRTDLLVYCNASMCQLMCPVDVPYQGKYKITSLTMFAYDNYSGQYARFYLFKNTPSSAGSIPMAIYQGTADSTDDPQAVTGPLSNARVQPKHDIFIRLTINGTQPMVYGFRLKYRPL